ncbi:MAG: hypothetical protein ACTSYL_07455 [Candidatus Thorarchaeota archaeon]
MSRLQSIFSVILSGIILSIFFILLFVPEILVSSFAAMMFFPALLVATIFLFVTLERGLLRERIYGPDRAFRFHNPDVFVRAIYDQDSGEQCLVRGSSDMTYHDTLERSWAFSNRPVDSAWLLVDDHGNDISQRTLASYDGPVYIVTQENRS